MEKFGILCAISDSNALTYPIILDKSKRIEKIKNVNIGNLLTINNNTYVITCFHCIKNTMEQYIIINDKKYKCKTKYISDELELACLEVIGFHANENCFTVYDFDLNINHINHDVEVLSCDIDTFCKKNDIIKLKIDAKVINIIDTGYDKLKSLNIPIIPRYSLQLIKSFDDIYELSGLSGSFIMYNEKIIGIISSIENSLLNVIPSNVIMRFINEIKLKSSFNGLCTIVGKFQSCDFTKESSYEKVYGQIIENTYNINYNNYDYNISKMIPCNTLKKSDIIIEINGMKLNNSFKLYDSKMDYYLDFRTYIALNFICGDKIPLKIMRSTQKDPNDYTERNIFIYARPLASLRYIPISFNNNLITIGGFTFIELSEDIINNYINIGVNIGISFSEYYLKNPYRNDNEYIVVLLDIDKTMINNTLLENTNEFGFPLININGKIYSMATISKINKRKLQNINEFKKLLDSQSDLNIQLSVNMLNKVNNFKMTIVDHKINSLKLDV
ncbi:peptidase S1 Pa clan [Fadolivirus algeromassiliense]|jgi:hypothetical protein|uniref:Peptidase S1 Pa clan n=1 Tax=Fadolivirus FV1/VV64 TaxID=3070911 RepID=A0A7D3UV82_9VIRU|nr:peptidase S1 Pa clan [Fadolivirus algeromassiliense]QKF93774.1 peptidase S1 Pa clan [Fadolivirus FV1/VV64]